MGEFLRKWVSRRLLKLGAKDAAKVMVAVVQYARTKGWMETLLKPNTPLEANLAAIPVVTPAMGVPADLAST